MKNFKVNDVVKHVYGRETYTVKEIINNGDLTFYRVQESNLLLESNNTVKATNSDLANELKDIVSKWVNQEFNVISLDVYKKCLDDQLYDYIEPISEDEINDSAEKKQERIDILEERIENINIFIDNQDYQMNNKCYLSNELPTYTIKYEKSIKLIDKYQTEIDSLYNEISELENERDTLQDDNYPIWNSLFELKSNWATLTDNAQLQGMGLINSNDCFNDTLFFTSCGHSFYSAYWIPLYLSIFKDTIATKYINVNYKSM